MHYLNLMTIKIYTLITLLPNRLFSWLPHSFSLTNLPSTFPNLSKYDNGHGISMANLHQQAPDVSQFYINFGKYLRPTRPIYTLFTRIVGHLAEWMYDITDDLERAYVSLFKLFGLVSSEGSIGKWYKNVQYIGFAIFMLLLVIYGVGMIFSLKGGFARMKNLIVGTMIATAFIAVLPMTTNAFAGGIQKVADYFVGNSSNNNTQSMLATGNTSGKGGDESVGDSIVRNNIVSIPSMTTFAGEHGQNSLNINSTNGKEHIFEPTHQQFSKQIPEQSYYVNLYHMKNDEQAGKDGHVEDYRDAWNGIGDGSTADFLSDVGGTGSYLDKNTIKQDISTVQNDLKDQSLFDAFKDSVAHAWNGGDKFFGKITGLGNGESEQDSSDDYNSDYNDVPASRFFLPYQYYIQGNGSDAQFKPLGQFGAGTSFMTGFHQSYANYSINWFNIFLGLITLIFMLSALIVKVTNSFYKLVVMYVTSGWFLMKNAAQHDKIKDFIKAFFGIFENLVLDMLFLRLFVIVYLDVNSAIARMPFSPIILGLLQVMATIGLYKVENRGMQSISAQISGQGNKSGNGFGALAAAATGGLAMRGISKGRRTAMTGGRGVKKTGQAGAHVAKGSGGGWQRRRNQMHPNDTKPNRMQQAGNKLGSITGSNGSRDGNPGSVSSGEPGGSGNRTSSGNTTNEQGKPSGDNNKTTGTPGSGNTNGPTNTPRPAMTTGEKVGGVLGYMTRATLGRARHKADPDYYARPFEYSNGNSSHTNPFRHSNEDDSPGAYRYTGHPGNSSAPMPEKEDNSQAAQKMRAQKQKKDEAAQQRHEQYRQKNTATMQKRHEAAQKQQEEDAKKKVGNDDDDNGQPHPGSGLDDKTEQDIHDYFDGNNGNDNQNHDNQNHDDGPHNDSGSHRGDDRDHHKE